MNTNRILLLKSLRLVAETLDAGLFIAAVVIAAPPVLSRTFPGSSLGFALPARRAADQVSAPIATILRAHAPKGYDEFAPFAVALVLFVAAWVLRLAARRLRVEILTQQELEKAAEAAEAARRAGGLASLGAGAPQNREQALEVYAKAKRLLEEQKRSVAFLSIDVVNSTGMKHGEDPVLAERDFVQYRKLLEGILAKRSALKSAWTPDGVMICFATLDDAIGTAQDLLRALPEFNKKVKSIKTDFAVRCGVNSGAVLYDEAVPMEQMSDESIDLAGHMQKHAEPGTLFVARAQADGRAGFAPSEKKIDGLETSVWSPR